MGSRSRKRRRERVPSAVRDEQTRAGLQPLAPGELPGAVRVASAIAALIAVANLAFLVFGWEVRGDDPKPGGVIAFSALMLVAAYFMWRGKYWAVLGFQALLAISCVTAALSLLVASNLRGAAVALFVLVGAGTLFWFLVRAMARLQMPTR